MLELKTKQQLSKEAQTLANSFSLVRFRSTTYLPADFETRAHDVTPPAERTMWIPLSKETIRGLAAMQFDTMFATDSELSSFNFMVAQASREHSGSNTSLLVRTPEGLKELRTDGALHDPSGEFVPNTLAPTLNNDADDKQEIVDLVAEWVDGEEEAHSLLYHLATALAPGWSAVKYVLLLGDGRNGKSLLLKMMQQVFGWENTSNVTRQHIAAQSPVVTELNGKLLNIVFDGQAEYLKDSGGEKTLIAGEVFPIRKLYESTPTPVQTNALFVEGLQHEPKSKDKSSALQKRLVRYHFPNVYPLNHGFERKVMSERSLGAFLSVLIDHYVREDEMAVKLAPTAKGIQLQLEHMFTNSLGLQFFKQLEESDALGISGVLNEDVTKLVQQFQSWRLKENDLGNWAEPDVLALFQPLVHTDRQSRRINGQPRKVRVVTSLKPEALAFIDTLKGDEEDDDTAALVAD